MAQHAMADVIQALLAENVVDHAAQWAIEADAFLSENFFLVERSVLNVRAIRRKMSTHLRGKFPGRQARQGNDHQEAQAAEPAIGLEDVTRLWETLYPKYVRCSAGEQGFLKEVAANRSWSKINDFVKTGKLQTKMVMLWLMLNLTLSVTVFAGLNCLLVGTLLYVWLNLHVLYAVLAGIATLIFVVVAVFGTKTFWLVKSFWGKVPYVEVAPAVEEGNPFVPEEAPLNWWPIRLMSRYRLWIKAGGLLVWLAVVVAVWMGLLALKNWLIVCVAMYLWKRLTTIYVSSWEWMVSCLSAVCGLLPWSRIEFPVGK